MTQAAQQAAVERELRIEARPETVYAFLTEQEKLPQWMGRKASFEPRQGGSIRLDYNGFNIMRGEFVELVPFERVVMTWGWEGEESTPGPGASRVTVTLRPDGQATILKLVHEGLTEPEGKAHAEGWDHFLPRLATVAAGRDPGRDEWAPREAEVKAAELRDMVSELEQLVEACSDEAWKSTGTSEGWPAGVTASHAASHLGLVHLAKAMVDGQRPPQADWTPDDFNAGNDKMARETAGVTRTQVLDTIRKDGPTAVQLLREMTDDEMEKSMAMAFAGGNRVTVRQMIDGPLLTNLREHIDSFARACGR